MENTVTDQEKLELTEYWERKNAEVDNSDYETLIAKLKKLAYESWPGDKREDRLEEFLRAKTKHYSEVLGLTELEILRALEKNRDYSCVNFYQEANFPDLSGVKIFDNLEQLQEKYKSKQFRCPACKGVSSHPYKCTCEGCDWKGYGLFRTLGKGLRFTIKEGFLKKPIIDEIFMPLEEEEVA
jgi:hypothetical protein